MSFVPLIVFSRGSKIVACRSKNVLRHGAVEGLKSDHEPTIAEQGDAALLAAER